MIGPSEMLLAFLVDLTIGDPRWLPHPVRLIGKAISRSEMFLRMRFSAPSGERMAGLLLVIIIALPSFFITLLIDREISGFEDGVIKLIGKLVVVYLISTTIAVRELIGSAKAVIESVKEGSVVAARRKLSMIVGRDTEDLSDGQVITAVIETLAENLSDGVIAPIFYLLLGGLPLAIAYKAVNTLDSMVGYKNDRYVNFGWAAARLDDFVNYVPARITGILIVFSIFFLALFRKENNSLSAGRAFLIMRRDGRNHTSPNSGIPEAAMAGGLGIRVGGPSTYGGVLIEKPFIGEGENGCVPAAEHAISIVYAASFLGASLTAISLSLRSIL